MQWYGIYILKYKKNNIFQKSLTDSPGSNESAATVVHKAPTINYVETSLSGIDATDDRLIMYSRSTSGGSSLGFLKKF